MSISDSGSSISGGGGGDYKDFRAISRARLLHEMLRSSETGDSKSWKVLIMDKVTVKVMSCSCKMADITDEGVSLVEDLSRRRQPLPSMDVIYFIQPSKEKYTLPSELSILTESLLNRCSLIGHGKEDKAHKLFLRCLFSNNVVMFLSDMSGRAPLYRKAYVYFSSPIPKELITRIKNDKSVLPRIGALREMNLEYFAIDSQGYITDQASALEDLFTVNGGSSPKFDICLNTMAKRIATVFASLKEFPIVRYRAMRGLDSDDATLRDLVPTKLAAAVWNIISLYKTTIPNFPQTETCEFLILDRTVDQIAPVIHEWTYDAMCHDLLDMDGNIYVHEVPNNINAELEKKEVLLEDRDPVWVELRDAHIAEASERLHDKMANFVSKNKAAQLQQRNGNELSTRDLQKMVQALPQYNEQMEKLSLHVQIAGKINTIIRDAGLRELGQLEQDLVFGDAGTKEVINFFRMNQDTSTEYKLRLMLIYASFYPQKFDGDKASKLMQLAKLSHEELKAVKNMISLEGTNDKKASNEGFSLKFDSQKRTHAARKDRMGEEETWQLFRFYPVIEELIEQLNKGELAKNEYQCMNEPGLVAHKATGGVHGATVRVNQSARHLVRSRRTATWARPRWSDDGNLSDSNLRSASSDSKKTGQRIFVFIIGGATRSELRACHKLTAKLKREIVFGSTSLDDPAQYIEKLKNLSGKELSIDDIRI